MRIWLELYILRLKGIADDLILDNHIIHQASSVIKNVPNQKYSISK